MIIKTRTFHVLVLIIN